MTGKPLRVLIVEDSEDDAALLVLELQRSGYAAEYRRVDTAAEMEAALGEPWDIVVSDWAMPRFSARAALAIVQRRGANVPFIIVSGTVDEATAVEAMRAGAHDFISKGRFSRLAPAIERELREAAGRAERREIERRLRHTQKMEAMGQLTGGIAHDFNNLLGVIVINAELLQGAAAGNPDQADLAGQILASAMHGADLTHRLLAFARQQPLDAEPVALDERLPRIVSILERTLGAAVAIRTVLADGLWRARIDPSQVEDALLNLAINARDAMPGGGTLTIETANVVLDRHYAEMHAEVTAGEYVLLAITDTGSGMPPDVLERAMEPFFTTKEAGKGTGLGLAMIYGFVKQSGGHLSIYSEVGTGTTVRLYLPRAADDVAACRPRTAGEPAPGGGEAILLIDDNADLRRVTMRMLAGLGYRVNDAGDGHAALALLADGVGADLLFTDIGLPGGIDGYDLAERARRLRPGLKVLFATGYGGESRAIRRGDDPLILKPYRGDELAARIRAVLAASPAR